MKSKRLTQASLGFTLIELLVALLIAAAISAMAYRALDMAIKANERVTRVTKEIDGVDRVWQYMSNDFLFAVPRPWRNSFGELRSPLIGVFGDRLSQSDVLVADEESYLLQMIRSDRDNLLDKTRSDLFMVGYRLTETEGSDLKSLWRDSWSPIDGAGEPQMQQRLLIDNIERVEFRYLSGSSTSAQDSQWITGWPSQDNNTQSFVAVLPVAVEISLDIPTLGKVVRLFELTPGA